MTRVRKGVVALAVAAGATLGAHTDVWYYTNGDDQPDVVADRLVASGFRGDPTDDQSRIKAPLFEIVRAASE